MTMVMRTGWVLWMMVGATAAMAQDAGIAVIQPDKPGRYGITVDGLAIAMEVRRYADETFAADLSVLDGGVEVVSRSFDELYSPYSLPRLRVVEMDGGNDSPEIQIVTWSGGAHCCNEVLFLTQVRDQWRTVDAGAYDGRTDPAAISDYDYDGAAEWTVTDDRFLYEFASYAGSWAPIRVLGLRDGEIADLSREEAFAHIIRGSLETMGDMPEDGEPRNSWLATYAATLATLGEEDPLDFAIGKHDPDATWGRERCTVPEVDYVCPDGKTEIVSFEVALRDFLTMNGYLEADQ